MGKTFHRPFPPAQSDARKPLRLHNIYAESTGKAARLIAIALATVGLVVPRAATAHQRVPRPIPQLSQHRTKALPSCSTVYNSCIQVGDYTPVVGSWDESDYSVLKSIAMGINMGSFDIETLKWPGNLKAAGTFEDGTNRMQWFVIPALAAYMKASRVAAPHVWARYVHDVLAQLDNDLAYLTDFLGADNKAHPMFTFLNLVPVSRHTLL
ncbi:hypothetical protein DFJ58DRAFT_726990 [Suillus subalutaceus]|uniref:uncharacterized protein n=1 Tax=Suillus subalutaceus TaxID=48586 RepID=UPI001B8685F3|nr:uncharacterized protein DFJ58DRAFT_726990 [Suillus subalutaceus]KAG1856971.1 hypothetical protein DFJ58DRAFT_726990 [Suillus subalutaceus]